VGVSKAYLDSSYLLALIKEEGVAREVESMLYRLRSNTFEVFVPHVVLGEVCGVIFRDFESDQDRRDKTTRLVGMMDSNGISWENMKPTERDAFNIMVSLSAKDELLDATDIMIVSHVLSDPDSKFFFTTDSNILENAAIIDLEKELSAGGRRRVTLKISDGF
jgi:predicted nucleic acid-binding protein